jgi:transcriptional regulator with XRE-family HTH domain
MRPVAVGHLIAEIRTKAGLTQAELARRIGTTQSAISRVENGRSDPTLGLLRRIARATGQEISIKLPAESSSVSGKERRRRVRRVLGDYRFDPWERKPIPAVARSLRRDGLVPKPR